MTEHPEKHFEAIAEAGGDSVTVHYEACEDLPAVVRAARALELQVGVAFKPETSASYAAHAAIALGTLAGGWRIVHTMGSNITKLRPVGGFCAETAGALTLFGTAWAGIPVSTTHTITGAIVGVGSTVRLSAVKWGVARRIVWAWIFTIPGAAIFAATSFLLIELVYTLVSRTI